MISDILQLAREVFGLREKLRGAKREERERLATYFEQIAGTLDDVGVALEAGRSTARECSKLHVYRDLIPAAAEEALGAAATDTLREGLGSALHVRLLEVRSEQDLEELAEAAGTFAGIADYLRAA